MRDGDGLQTTVQRKPLWHFAFAGAAGDMAAVCVTQPFDLVKVRMQLAGEMTNVATPSSPRCTVMPSTHHWQLACFIACLASGSEWNTPICWHQHTLSLETCVTIAGALSLTAPHPLTPVYLTVGTCSDSCGRFSDTKGCGARLLPAASTVACPPRSVPTIPTLVTRLLVPVTLHNLFFFSLLLELRRCARGGCLSTLHTLGHVRSCPWFNRNLKSRPTDRSLAGCACCDISCQCWRSLRDSCCGVRLGSGCMRG
jgi:hypothetical protein